MVVETIRCSASLCTARASPSWQQEQRAYVFRRQSSLHQCDLLAARSVGEMPASKCRDIYTRRDLLPVTITDSERGNGQPGRREREVGLHFERICLRMLMRQVAQISLPVIRS